MAKKKAASRKKSAPPPAVGLKAARKAAKAETKSVKTTSDKQTTTKTKETTMTNAKQFEKLTNDATALGQENVEAFIQSGTLFFKGAEDIVKTYAALAQESAQKNAEAVQTLLGCKTLNELTETQTKLARDAVEGFVAQATKLSELSLKVAKDSLEPINAQVTKTVKRTQEAA